MTGAVQWARRVGGAADDHVAGVAVDGADNAYVLGSFQGAVDSAAGRSRLRARRPSSCSRSIRTATYRWARKLDGTNLGAGAGAIASGGGGAVAVVGSYQGSLTVDATTFTSVGASDLFAVELTAAAGATLWARSFGGAGRDLASGVALDGAGNAVLTGMFEGSIDFGGGVLAAPTALNGYVLAARGGGGFVLARQLVGPKVSQGAAVAVDPAGNLLVAGTFHDSLSLGCGAGLTASQPGQDDVFLAKLVGGRVHLGEGVRRHGGRGLGLAAPGRVGGRGEQRRGRRHRRGVLRIALVRRADPRVSERVPATNAFAARLAGDGAHRRAIRAGGIAGAFASGVAQAADGRFFVTGDFSGLAEFGGTAFTSSGPADAFIAGVRAAVARAPRGHAAGHTSASSGSMWMFRSFGSGRRTASAKLGAVSGAIATRVSRAKIWILPISFLVMLPRRHRSGISHFGSAFFERPTLIVNQAAPPPCAAGSRCSRCSRGSRGSRPRAARRARGPRGAPTAAASPGAPGPRAAASRAAPEAPAPAPAAAASRAAASAPRAPAAPRAAPAPARRPAPRRQRPRAVPAPPRGRRP